MLIEKVTLYSPNLIDQRTFYGEVLGFEIIEIQDGFKIRTGHSEINFIQSDEKAIYHFAWNIPINKLNDAIEWCSERFELITYEDEVIQNFEDWNADAIYFYDEDQNILELIARYNTQPESEEDFGVESFLGLCEMALVVDDIETIFHKMRQRCNISMYSGNMKRFCAAGDEEGMFIIVNRNEKDTWFPTGDIAEIKAFECVISISDKTFDVLYNSAGELLIQDQI